MNCSRRVKQEAPTSKALAVGRGSSQMEWKYYLVIKEDNSGAAQVNELFSQALEDAELEVENVINAFYKLNKKKIDLNMLNIQIEKRLKVESR